MLVGSQIGYEAQVPALQAWPGRQHWPPQGLAQATQIPSTPAMRLMQAWPRPHPTELGAEQSMRHCFGPPVEKQESPGWHSSLRSQAAPSASAPAGRQTHEDIRASA